MQELPKGWCSLVLAAGEIRVEGTSLHLSRLWIFWKHSFTVLWVSLKGMFVMKQIIEEKDNLSPCCCFSHHQKSLLPSSDVTAKKDCKNLRGDGLFAEINKVGKEEKCWKHKMNWRILVLFKILIFLFSNRKSCVFSVALL